MATIMIRCPTTGEPIPVGFDENPDAFRRKASAMGSIHCPRCGAVHRWQHRDAWIERSSPSIYPGPEPTT